MKCDSCKNDFPENEIIIVRFKDGYIENNYLCCTCLKDKMRKLLKFENINECLDIIIINDVSGKKHCFTIEEHKYLIETLWEAYEIENETVKKKSCEISFKSGKTEQAFNELLDKIIQGLNSKPEEKASDNNKYSKQLLSKELHGVISEDEFQTIRTPKFIIEGKEYTLLELGKMLINYEGWSFKIEIAASPEKLKK